MTNTKKEGRVFDEYLRRLVAVYALRLLKLRYSLKDLATASGIQATTLSKYYNGLVLPDMHNSNLLIRLFYEWRREIYKTIIQKGEWNLLALALALSLYYHIDAKVLGVDIDYIASIYDPSMISATIASQLHNIEGLMLVFNNTYVPFQSTCKPYKPRGDSTSRTIVVCMSPKRTVQNKVIMLIEPILYPEAYIEYSVGYLLSEGAREIIVATHSGYSMEKTLEYPVKIIEL